jgi:hypothetical protein
VKIGELDVFVHPQARHDQNLLLPLTSGGHWQAADT